MYNRARWRGASPWRLTINSMVDNEICGRHIGHVRQMNLHIGTNDILCCPACIPVPWDRMKYSAALDAYEINLSDAELSHAPEEFDWGYRDDVIANLNFYRTPPY